MTAVKTHTVTETQILDICFLLLAKMARVKFNHLLMLTSLRKVESWVHLSTFEMLYFQLSH